MSEARSSAPLVPLVVVGAHAAYRPPPSLGMPRVGPRAEVLADAARLEEQAHPRWVVAEAAAGLGDLVEAGVPIARVWDTAQAHRLWQGGWRAEPAFAWACAHDLPRPPPPPERLSAQPDQSPSLFDLDLTDLDPDSAAGQPNPDPDEPVGPDGGLRPGAFGDWAAGNPARVLALGRWLGRLAAAQHERLAPFGPRAVATAHSESAAALLCLELQRDGLPLDRARAEAIVAHAAGPRPRDEAHAGQIRRERDAVVLRHAGGRSADLRNPAQVKDLLAACGVSVATTRKGELEPYRATHPIVAALLTWRAQERIATTYGYRWLDEHVGPDGRLRGAWSACDGAAGRMTAQAGLHNLPAVLRRAIVAEPGHVLVRADLGQIEPRVLAAVSGDDAFAAATRADDLYAPVAAALGVPRPVAKVAVLAAMYGQRTGAAGQALRDLQRAFPVAMGFLDEAYAAGLAGQPVRTFGGRAIPMGGGGPDPGPRGAARGRFARNAVIQGAAAELFKAWAATVRPLVRPIGGQIVLCLHDELLVHAQQDGADAVVAALREALADSSRRWLGHEQVRFVADVSVVTSWDEAK